MDEKMTEHTTTEGRGFGTAGARGRGARGTARVLAAVTAIAVFAVAGCVSSGPASSEDASETGGPAVRKRTMRALVSRDALLALARKYIGVPYKFGGSTPKGFDCSGYTYYVYGQAGQRLPHGAGPQYNQLRKVSKPEPGDLVFFRTYTSGVSHVGIFVGKNQFLHSPTTGRTVSYADMASSYWKTRYVGAASAYSGGKAEPAPKKEPTPKKEPEPKVVNQDLLNFEMIQTIYKGDESGFTRFLEQGANPGAIYQDWSALMLAAYYNRVNMIKALLAKKPDVNYRAPRGWTALSVARDRGHKEIEALLFAAGAVRTRAVGRPPAMPDPAAEQF